MSIKISQMNPSPSAALTDAYEINKSGVTYQQSLMQVKTLYNSYYLQIANKLSELSAPTDAAQANQNFGNLGPAISISIPGATDYQATNPLARFIEVTFINELTSRFVLPTSNVATSPNAYNSAFTLMVNTGDKTGQVIDQDETLIAYINPGQAIIVWNNSNSTATGAWQAYTYLTNTISEPYVNGSLTFNDLAARILANFSDATDSNRLLFQTSTNNTNTYIGAMPKGTGFWAAWRAYGKADVNNSHFVELYGDNGGGSVGINAAKNGSGTQPQLWLSHNLTPVLKITDATNITVKNLNIENGSQLKTGTTNNDSYALSAYGSGTHKDFITFTCNGPIAGLPQCVISAPAGGVLAIDGAAIGGTTRCDAKLTTLDANSIVALGNAAWNIDASGRATNPKQPAFLVRNSTNRLNVTGDGTGYTLIFNTEIKDQGGVFDGTSTFTAPVAGSYPLNGAVTLYGLDSSYTLGTVIIVTSNRNYEYTLNPGAMCDAGGNLTYVFSPGLVEMDAGDTAFVIVFVSGGSKTVNVVGAEILTFFNGFLAC